jgi:uncharacterized protein (DUF1810 family)
MDDPHRLQRFVDAQDGVFDRALGELRGGCKRSHWMWFIFPQAAGLGFSEMARLYAIASRKEAAAYLGHPILGPRLVACAQAVCRIEGCSAHDIFASPDDFKFRSSMTLFAEVAADEGIFAEASRKYFDGRPDDATLKALGGRL